MIINVHLQPYAVLTYAELKFCRWSNKVSASLGPDEKSRPHCD